MQRLADERDGKMEPSTVFVVGANGSTEVAIEGASGVLVTREPRVAPSPYHAPAPERTAGPIRPAPRRRPDRFPRLMPACYRHPDRETNVGCSNCGRPICPDCMTSTPVGMRCPECARERTRVVRAPAGLGSGATPATFVLIALSAIGFLAELATGATLFAGGGDVYRDYSLVGAFVADGEVYRIVTSGFLHYGLLHLGLNMFALYFLGNLLEPALGWRRFVAIYAVSLLGGSLGVILLEPDARAVGASGAIFGLMAAAFLIARDRGLDDLASQIGFIVILNLVFTFSIPGISIGGHLGGLMAGGLCAFLIAAAGRQGPQGRALEVAGFVALAAIAVAGCVLLAPEPQPPFG